MARNSTPSKPIQSKTIQQRSADGLWLSMLGVLLLYVATTVGPVSAHPVLVPRPTMTLTDWVLLSDSLVLAREDSERPFHYARVKTLTGDPGTEPIDLFLPSQLRRRLAMDEELTMLLARGSKSGDWRALGLASDDYLRVVQRILEFDETWTPKETDNLPRLQEFSSLLGHEDVRLHELAYLEIGRASYASIRSVGADVPLERVRAQLNNPIYFDWRGLDIMLLGLSKNEVDRKRVIREMKYLQSQSLNLNLAAWATAYVEVAGEAAIDEFTDWYFRNAGRSRDELREISRALAGHANENLEMRQSVVDAYRVLLENHPGVAPDITHDLIAWQRWDFAEEMQALKPVLARKDPLGAHKVNLFLMRAKRYNRDQ